MFSTRLQNQQETKFLPYTKISTKVDRSQWRSVKKLNKKKFENQSLSTAERRTTTSITNKTETVFVVQIYTLIFQRVEHTQRYFFFKHLKAWN